MTGISALRWRGGRHDTRTDRRYRAGRRRVLPPPFKVAPPPRRRPAWLSPRRWRAWASGAAVVALDLSLAYGGSLAIGVPNVAPLATPRPVTTSYMNRRAAQLALPSGTFVGGRTALRDVSPLLVCAVIKAEDPFFFDHHGFDWPAIREALKKLFRDERTGGASTITQQLARNLYLGPQRTIHRKLREALITRELEAQLGKQRIVELYMNVAELGDGVWGVAAASRHYFGKEPSDLDAFEATFLASLLPAPRRPLAGTNARRAWSSQHRITYEMYNSGLLEADDWRAVMARASAVHAALDDGVPLLAALRRRVAPRVAIPPAAPRRVNTPLPRDRWLPEACGIRRELFEPGWVRFPRPVRDEAL